MDGIRARFGHIGPVEGLRGVAVLWVVAFHYVVVREGTFAADPWIALARAASGSNVMVHHGYLGVDLFFLITGFLLVLPWLRAAEGGTPAPAALTPTTSRSPRRCSRPSSPSPGSPANSRTSSARA